MYQYLQTLAKRKPVVYTGDLNVGHLDLDIHNPTAKHIVKQAGLTPQERNSMTSFLSSGIFKDAFRFFYPSNYFLAYIYIILYIYSFMFTNSIYFV